MIAALLLGSIFLLRGATQAAEITVHNVDELIAAIAPGTVIHLEDGVYDLSQAESYGKRSGNPYVRWNKVFLEEYELTIHDLDGLTLTGSGEGAVEFLSRCQGANVLALEYCTEVTFNGFTAGHSIQAEGCSAGVVYVDRCEDIVLQEMKLYGCGSVGVQAHESERVSVRQVDVYECSQSGLDFCRCNEVDVNGCHVYNNGKTIDGWMQGYTAISMIESENLNVMDCSFDGNTLCYFLTAYDSQNVQMQECRTTGNSFVDAVFLLNNADIVVNSSCLFADNVFSHWYERDWDGIRIQQAKDENGNVVFPEDPEPLCTDMEPAEAVSVTTGEQKPVHVTNVEEFLAAIDSDTQIILADGEYDLSTAADYGTGSGEHYFWEPEYDGAELTICDVENFSVVSESGDAQSCIISAEPRYADVLTFQNCRNVTVQGITAGHTVEPGICGGGVLDWRDCADILVDQCRLYGCGILGVSAWQSQRLQVINSCIYECSEGGIACIECQGITVGGCEFWDLGGDVFQFSGCTDVHVGGQNIGGNYRGD